MGPLTNQINLEKDIKTVATTVYTHMCKLMCLYRFLWTLYLVYYLYNNNNNNNNNTIMCLIVHLSGIDMDDDLCSAGSTKLTFVF